MIKKVLFVVPTIGYGRDRFFETIHQLADLGIFSFHAFETDLRIETEDAEIKFVLSHRLDMCLRGNHDAKVFYTIDNMMDYILSSETVTS